MLVIRERIRGFFLKVILSVPVRIKIGGIMILPVLIMGIALNYWIRTGLSDWLSYQLTDVRVATAMEAGGKSVLIVTALVAILSVMLSFLLMLILTRPLLELVEVSQKVSGGDWDSRARIWATDEIGAVSQAFNAMIAELTTHQKALERTNRRLEAINRVAISAGRELQLDQVLRSSLKATLDVMGLERGWIYLLDSIRSGSPVYRLETTIGIDLEIREALGELRVGSCNCGDFFIWQGTEGKIRIHDCTRLFGLVGGDMHGHLTIPLTSREAEYGTLNLLCAVGIELSEDDVHILTTIGAHLSEVVANASLHASLVEKEASRQALLKALVDAQENERARLARRLHDGAGQSLTSLLVRMKGLERLSHDPAYRAKIDDLCMVVSNTIEQVRDISYRLRPAALEEFGLKIAIETLVEDVSESLGIRADTRLEMDEQRLPFEIETSLYRIAQESLTNIIRHAAAKNIRVELIRFPLGIYLRIEDDGVGFNPLEVISKPDGRRLGIVGMQERAEMLGGTLEVHSEPGVGTFLQVHIPCEALESL